MKTSSKVIAAVLGVAVFGFLAYSQLPTGGTHSMPGMGTSASTSESANAYGKAMTGMMAGMMVPLTGKPDLDFMQGMIPHHQGAIDMAKIVLQYGKDAEIRTLAENVVKAQEGEIAFMQGWLGKTDQSTLAAVPESSKANGEAMATLMKNMMLPPTGDADVDFVKGMIPHHQGAIDMAKVALPYAKDPEVLKLANDIVTAQETEIAFMTDWLARKAK